MKFLTYNPEQAYLLPPSVRDVLGENHVCFFLHRAVGGIRDSRLATRDSGLGNPNRESRTPNLGAPRRISGP